MSTGCRPRYAPNTTSCRYDATWIFALRSVRKVLVLIVAIFSQYEAVIQPGNEALVHHMEVFHCEAPSTLTMPEYQGPCFSQERPEVTKVCKRVLAAWAMGALPFSYPEVAHVSVSNVFIKRMYAICYEEASYRDRYCFRRLACPLEGQISIPTSC